MTTVHLCISKPKFPSLSSPEFALCGSWPIYPDADTALATALNFPVGVSCGTAVYPADGVSAEELLAAADRRMYGEKKHRQPAGPSP